MWSLCAFYFRIDNGKMPNMLPKSVCSGVIPTNLPIAPIPMTKLWRSSVAILFGSTAILTLLKQTTNLAHVFDYICDTRLIFSCSKETISCWIYWFIVYFKVDKITISTYRNQVCSEVDDQMLNFDKKWYIHSCTVHHTHGVVVSHRRLLIYNG